jgi:glutamine cyclotransferase
LRLFCFAALSFLVGGAALSTATRHTGVPDYGYEIIRVYPHDRTAFTQGLEYRDGFLYEGTGLHGRSMLRREDLATGKILQKLELPDQLFGEGITVLKGRIIQLTWQSHIGFVYDPRTFGLLRKFSYSGEGWGLANDGHQLYMSDGTAQIRYLDPTSLQELRRITVHEDNQQIEALNELEWVRGELYANVWQRNQIVRIDPRDGTVLGWIDLPGLLTPAEQADGADVLNGIAYDSTGDRLFVTGKLWPKLFQIRVVRKTVEH